MGGFEISNETEPKRNRSLSRSFKNLFTSSGSSSNNNNSGSSQSINGGGTGNTKEALKIKRNIPLVAQINTGMSPANGMHTPVTRNTTPVSATSSNESSGSSDSSGSGGNSHGNSHSGVKSPGATQLYAPKPLHLDTTLGGNRDREGKVVFPGSPLVNVITPSPDSQIAATTGNTSTDTGIPSGSGSNSGLGGNFSGRNRRRGNSNASLVSQESHVQPRRSNTVSMSTFHHAEHAGATPSGNGSAGGSTNGNTGGQFQNQAVIYKSESFVLFKNFMHEHHLTVVPLITVSSSATAPPGVVVKKVGATPVGSPLHQANEVSSSIDEHLTAAPSQTQQQSFQREQTPSRETQGAGELERVTSDSSTVPSLNDTYVERSVSPGLHSDVSVTDLPQHHQQQQQQQHQNLKLPKASGFSISTLFKLHKNDSHILGSNNSSTANLSALSLQDPANQTQFSYHSSSGYALSKREVECNNRFNSNIKYAQSLIYTGPNSYKNKKNNSNSNNTSNSQNPNTPNIVNNKAAISEHELNLINDLTTKMKNAMNKPASFAVGATPLTPTTTHEGASTLSASSSASSLASADHESANSTITGNCYKDTMNNAFTKKYGFCIGTLGQGSYGVVKVSCKKLDKVAMANLDPNCKKTFRYKDSAFFAIKELRPINRNSNTPGFKSPNDFDNEDKISSKNKSGKPLATQAYDEKFCTRLTSEFVIGHALNHIGRHPNILKVLDLFTFSNMPNKFVQIMEFCPSGDLYSLVKSHPSKLHPLEIDCFMKQLVNGVSYMHEHGVAHCDLKPENLLFKPNGILKISDFGTACVFQTAWEKKCHMQTGCVGSEPYMAPEQFVPRKQYDPRLVDSWSIGVIYMAMSLGRYLWKSPIKDKDPEYATYLESIDYRPRESSPGAYSRSESSSSSSLNSSDDDREGCRSPHATADATGDYRVFEDLKHVNNDIKMARLAVLYKIFNPNPTKRVLVKEILSSTWMKKTHCCVVYRHTF